MVSETSPESFRTWATGLQRASYQRRKSAGLTCERGYSFWPTPTFKSSGNRVCLQPVPGGVRLLKDETQAGKQLGLKNAVQSWVLMWDLLMALGWGLNWPIMKLSPSRNSRYTYMSE